MTSRSADIAIIGGGLAGLATARAVAQAGLRAIHLAPPAPPDRRTSALMGPSADLLHALGLFAEPEELGTPLKRIRIIDATSRLFRAPETLFDSAEAALPAFGWNFPNARLSERFAELEASDKSVETLPFAAKSIQREKDGWRIELDGGETLLAKLIVGADGKKSLVREQAGIGVSEHKFEQSALVADLDLVRPLDGESVEFHYPNGPFTLVPATGNRANLVWIDKADVLEQARALTPEEQQSLFTEKAQHLFGPIKLASPTFVFPLSTLEATKAGADGIVLIGESAHAFPPIGAQGLNLGLRDVAAFQHALASSEVGADSWANQVSAAYAQKRASDIRRTGTFVDTLFKSLLSDFLPAQALRAGGLWALKLSPSLRKRAFEQGMGVQKAS